MMWCSVDEAFDNDLHQKVQELDNNNKIPPEMGHHMNPSKGEHNFFTAQGDIANPQHCQGPYYGTPISALQREHYNSMNNENIDSLYESDGDLDDSGSLFTDPSLDLSMLEDKKQHSHEYCVAQFVNSILNDDATIMTKDASIYDHIKSCKYCRKTINAKLKEARTDEEVTTSTSIIPKEGFGLNLGYDFKEIALIIIFGIGLICILDLLVNLGRKV